MTRVCSYHCAPCGTHFASLEAFDLHRAGSYADRRYCLDADEVDRLAADPAVGVCRLTKGVEELTGVVIYASARHLADRENAVQRMRGSERPAAEAEHGLDLGRAA